jgi:hypothetical protein
MSTPNVHRAELAERFLRDSNLAGEPCSAYALADAAGLELTPTRRQLQLGIAGRELRYDARAPRQWQEAFITRCVAQWTLAWYGEPSTPEALSAVTRALLHRPRRERAGHPHLRSACKVPNRPCPVIPISSARRAS